MTLVHTPVAGFTGTVVGVQFVDGTGETTDRSALAYFARHGYSVGDSLPFTAEERPDDAEPGTPLADDGRPLSDFTVAELRDIAKERGMDVPTKAHKADIIGLLELH